VRDELGEGVDIRIDSNAAWTESTALVTIRRLEKYGLSNIEEPCGSLESNSKIRRRSKTPISTHSTRVIDVANAGLDVAVVNPIPVGGFARLRKQVSVAEERGLDVWLHSRGELGFATAAYLHFVAANRWLSLPNQTLMRPTEHMLTKEPKPTLEKGVMKLPEGPGLGVTLDTNSLDKYNSLFREVGEYNWLGGSGRSPPFF
jgi:glucarate dehydratase